MINFDLTILGSNAAFPSEGRFTTAQFLHLRNHYFLIDCGEGTQIQLSTLKVKYSRLQRIFISHTHGDHLLGLPGVLGTFGLLGRSEPLHIHAPFGVQEFVEAYFRYSHVRRIGYPIFFHVHSTEKSAVIFETADLEVRTIPLQHDVPTAGFLFHEKPEPRKMRKDAIEEFKIPFQAIPAIKNGADFTLPSGVTVANARLTLPPPPNRSFAFCSDTAYTESIVPFIQGVDLLYHEATFGEDKAADLLQFPYHSTARQAAQIALIAGVKRLIIGHFSPRYKDLTLLLQEARSVFPNTDLALDGRVFSIERAEGDESKKTILN